MTALSPDFPGFPGPAAPIPYTKSGAEKRILVLLQPHREGLHPISRELAAAARRLAASGGLKTAGVFIAGELTAAAEAQLRDCGLEDIYLYQDKGYRSFIPERYAAALVHCIGTLRPEILLVGATPEGRCLAPLAAVPLETGVTADCTELSLDPGGLLVQTRPAFGGSLMARIVTPEARPQIATVRYGVFPSGGASQGASQEASQKAAQKAAQSASRLLPAAAGPFPPVRTQVEALTAAAGDDGGEEPRCILALGGGVRVREDIGLFSKMAETLGAALMCSRSLVERLWLPQSLQIGLSGRCVAPRLLIALGVSGSVQFMAGIQGAKKICALNTDPRAPILRIADIPLVSDIYQLAALYGN
jgi:electron transfer flavoprotein alpha subunit